MPLQALVTYRTIFSAHATPTPIVDDRGGDATATLRRWPTKGSRRSHSAKGQGAWRVAEAVRETVRSERGKTEGIIGTLKMDTYGFNKAKERLWQTLEMAGPRSILSFSTEQIDAGPCTSQRVRRQNIEASRIEQTAAVERQEGSQNVARYLKSVCDTL